MIYERRPYEYVLTFPNGMKQTIGLWREDIHNGAHRDWFYLDGRRARRLWLAPDEVWFRDRKHLGLEYGCRRRREARRDEKITMKLGPPRLDGRIRKPEGLRRSAFRAMLGKLGRIRSS